MKRFNPYTRFTLLQYACYAELIHLGVQLLGYKRMLRLLEKRKAVQPKEEYEGEALRQLVYPLFVRLRNSKYLRANCLSTSLLLWKVLQRRGIDASLQVGTRFEKEAFKAHAWVEYKGIPLNEHPDVRAHYQAFSHDFGTIF